MDVARIYRGLATSVIGQSIVHFANVGSTNNIGMSMAQQGVPEGTVLIADYQAGGRGRQGRAWLSAPDESLLMSVILRPKLPPADAFYLTMAPALAVLETVELLGVSGATLKWPNDVLAGGRKIAGILAELSLRGDQIDYVVVGIGLNVNLDPSRYPEIAGQATSLMRELGRSQEREEVAKVLLAALEARYLRLEQGQADEVFRDWRDRLVTLGREVDVTEGGQTYRAFARDVMADGGLVIERDGGRVVVYAGDVTIVR